MLWKNVLQRQILIGLVSYNLAIVVITMYRSKISSLCLIVMQNCINGIWKQIANDVSPALPSP